MLVGIVDYEVGNIFSVVNTFEYLRVPHFLSSDKRQLRNASHIVLPGVGSFTTGVSNLRRLDLWDFTKDIGSDPAKPMLCICLGMQLLLEGSEEDPTVGGLGLIKGAVEVLPESRIARRPQIGWNEVYGGDYSSMKLTRNVTEYSSFYFVHGYHCVIDENVYCTYTDFGGVDIVAALEVGNTMAVQFHPEKSQSVGAELIRNFLHDD